jgi:hypothetical protein
MQEIADEDHEVQTQMASEWPAAQRRLLERARDTWVRSQGSEPAERVRQLTEFARNLHQTAFGVECSCSIGGNILGNHREPSFILTIQNAWEDLEVRAADAAREQPNGVNRWASEGWMMDHNSLCVNPYHGHAAEPSSDLGPSSDHVEPGSDF